MPFIADAQDELGVTHYQQWTDHITNENLLSKLGITKCIVVGAMYEWLGHVCRINDSQQPKFRIFNDKRTD